ncbi:hypothetical protein Tco_0321863 [Tanacetum coccineum]
MLKIQKSIHPLSGSTTSSFDSFPSLTSFETSDPFLEEFADELALVDSFPSEKDDDLFDFEDNNDEWRNILYHDPFDDIQSDDDDDLFDLKSDNDEWKKLLYGDSFMDIDSENDKNKDLKAKLLIDELESPESNILLPQLLECDSTLHEELPEIDTLPSFPSGNEDKVFNLGILVHGSTQIVTKVTPDKILILEECNVLSHSSDHSSDRDLLFFLESTVTETLLLFSSENEDKVFNPEILISKGDHSLTLGLSHQNYEAFQIINPNILNESPMKIFPFFYLFCGGDISSFDVPYLYFYPP